MNWYPARIEQLRKWDGKPLAGYGLWMGLWALAFDHGGLPNDPKKVASLAEYTAKQMNLCWQEFVDCCVVMENGRLMPGDIVEAERRMIATQQQHQEAGRKGGQSKKQPKFRPAASKDSDLQEAPLEEKSINDIQQDVEQKSEEDFNNSSDLQEAPLYATGTDGASNLITFPKVLPKSSTKTSQELDPVSTEISELQEAKSNQYKILNTKEEIESNANKGVETGENITPFDSFDFSTDAKADEKYTNEIELALRAIFRALPAMSGRISELKMFIKELKAPAAYVLAWPKWFRSRYPGKPANHFQFGDTFAELAEEGLEPDAWLNGSGGARLVAGICGYLTMRDATPKPVSAAVAHEIVSYGHWLDSQTGLHSRDEWVAAGITPAVFNKFWKERFSGAGKPKPETVIRYWRDFSESLPGRE